MNHPDLRTRIDTLTYASEQTALEALRERAELSAADRTAISRDAAKLVRDIRSSTCCSPLGRSHALWISASRSSRNSGPITFMMLGTEV